MPITGTIYPRETLVFRKEVGNASIGGIRFELSVNVSDHSPIVRCLNTGKWFSLDWPQIIAAAQSAGIDQDACVTLTNHGTPVLP